jgi:hypothetical protein
MKKANGHAWIMRLSKIILHLYAILARICFSCGQQLDIYFLIFYRRYVNDGRPFWQFIVSSSTGCSDARYFEELYSYYTTEKVR